MALRDTVFYHEHRLRPSIRALLRDTKCAAGARETLALIGEPDDLELVVRLAPPPHPRPGFENRWAYAVVSALLEPGSESEWSFLRAAALNQFGDRRVDAGAVQTLKLIASQRSTAILEEVRNRNADRARSCSKAIDYILSKPPALIENSLERLAKRVAEVNRIGEWQRNRNTRYNADGDKALVDIVYATSEDIFVHTATFHRIDGLWRLRGVRETLQQFFISVTVPATATPEIPVPPNSVASPPVLPPSVDDLLRSLLPPKPPSDTTAPQQKK